MQGQRGCPSKTSVRFVGDKEMRLCCGQRAGPFVSGPAAFEYRAIQSSAPKHTDSQTANAAPTAIPTFLFRSIFNLAAEHRLDWLIVHFPKV
jgi:hypothetical protein